MMMGFVGLYYFFLIDAGDPYKCGSLLQHGQWRDLPKAATSSGPPMRNWQPRGCMMHDYTSQDVATCLAAKRMVFIGDSTIRLVFFATARKMDREEARQLQVRTANHSDVTFRSSSGAIDFVWDPYLNSTRLRAELWEYFNGSFSGEKDPGRSGSDIFFILLGSGLWFARFLESNPVEQFKNSINGIENLVGTASASNRAKCRAGSNKGLFLAPVQSPFYDLLSPERSANITPDKVDAMNNVLRRSALHGVEVVWTYLSMTQGHKPAFDPSGLHVLDNIAEKQADILLNAMCNSKNAHAGGRGYPNDRTCCNTYGSPRLAQYVVLSLGLIILPWIHLLKPAKQLEDRIWLRLSISPWTFPAAEQLRSIFPSQKIVRSLRVCMLAACFCFCADRTQIFNKMHKQFSSAEFAALCWLTLAVGAFSLRRTTSGPAEPDPRVSSTPPDRPFLDRSQTDEWKGWMQFIVLIYHYTGGSKVLPIYKFVRVLVASYLFMTGFGHTQFFLKKRDYSFRRVAAVLLRLNFLSCLLPYVMWTDYQFYYFAPLVSFWFVVVYLTLAVGRTHNHDCRFLLAKLLMSIVAVIRFTQDGGPVDAIFVLLYRFCRTRWDEREWSFRVSLDMFIVYVGMACAILCAHASSSAPPPGDAFGKALRELALRPAVRWATVAVAAVALPAFFWLTAQRWTSKYDYNRWHPYISPLPILAFVVLRNAHRRLRGVHSAVFAWLGRCSLETFTLQYHMWLAADTRGVLSLGLFLGDGEDRPGAAGVGRWLELGLLTAVFLWTSSDVAHATGIITSWIVGPEASSPPSSAAQTEALSLELPLHASAAGEQRAGTGSSEKPAVFAQLALLPALITRLWWADLRLRIALLLFGMWMVNVASYP